MDEGKNFIAFTKSRKNVEIVLKETRDHLEAEGFLGTHKPDEISGYRGGYTPLERKQIENQMEYPGQIKVSIVRESRAVDYAK